MTTRYYDVITPSRYEVYSATGTNGKYEVVGGKTRTKWNNYDLLRRYERRTKSIAGNYIDCTNYGPLSPSIIFQSNDFVTVQSRLSQQIKGHEFNLAVAAAEGPKTVKMVTNALEAVGGAFLDLKRGRFANAARRFGVDPRRSQLDHRDVAGRWLELQYGWLPLIKDVHESMKAFEVHTKGPRSKRYYASLKKTSTVDTSAAPSIWRGLCNYEAKIVIIAELQENLSVPRSLGLTNPASVLWELLPYSFVVDWFIPIGSYLENLNVLQGLQGRFLTVQYVKHSVTGIPKPIGIPLYGGATAFGGGVRLIRTVSSSMDVAKPGINSLPDAMSPKRIWNSIALAAQRFK